MRQCRRYLPWVLPSLLALVAPAVWIVSSSVPAGLYHSRVELHDGIFDFHVWHFALNNGEIAFEYAHFNNPANPQLRQDFGERYRAGTNIRREPRFYRRSGFLGFSLTLIPNPTRKIFSLSIPIWLFALLGAIPLLRRLARIWVARERSRTTLCPACGYDLRSTPGRCPECGAVPDEVAIAHDASPAVIAVARSSGTKCVALMAGYMGATVFVYLLAAPTRHFYFNGPWSHDYSSSVLYGLIGLAILLGGAFHAAGYSRSGESFFGCGALASLLLTPVYVYMGRSQGVWTQLAAVIACAVLLGMLVCAAAAARWRLQDRATMRESTGARRLRPSADQFPGSAHPSVP